MPRLSQIREASPVADDHVIWTETRNSSLPRSWFHERRYGEDLVLAAVDLVAAEDSFSGVPYPQSVTQLLASS